MTTSKSLERNNNRLSLAVRTILSASGHFTYCCVTGCVPTGVQRTRLSRKWVLWMAFVTAIWLFYCSPAAVY